MKYQNGNQTQLAEQAFLRKDCYEEVDAIPADVADYISASKEFNLFSDKLRSWSKSCGYTGDCENTNKLVSFLLNRCKETGVDGLNRQTLVNWLSKGAPTGNSRSRELVYRLCFALKLNSDQTTEFFLKAYLDRPFNVKNLSETVYYFCLNTGRDYQASLRLIETIKARMASKDKNVIPEAVYTESILKTLQGIRDEADFVNYIYDHRSQFAVQNYSATEKIRGLLESCKALANQVVALTEYNDLHMASDAHYVVETNSQLLSEIYGRPARQITNDVSLVWKSLSDSDFPLLIRRNMLQDQQLSDIFNGKASYETIRKALILLSFYNYYAAAELNNSDGDPEEFYEELNTCLAECGYVQLYWRNPYDWVFAYCAQQFEPLEVFRYFVDKYAGPETR